MSDTGTALTDRRSPDSRANVLEAAVAAETLDEATLVEEQLPDPAEPLVEPVATAEGEDIPVPPGAPRALLGSLMGPHRRRIVLAVLMIVLQQAALQVGPLDRKSTRLNSSHVLRSRMPSSA